MRLFGPVHLVLLAVIAAAAALLSILARRSPARGRLIVSVLGITLAANEIVWWVFRYSHEGFRFPQNVPLQLCDAAVWLTVCACLTRIPLVVEFAYFGGLAGAGMATLMPDLWSPWPSYPAVYFFLAHGGIVIGVSVLVFGKIAPLRRGAVWRAFAFVVAYAAVVGSFDAVFNTNYMYLCGKPRNASLLDLFGPWPMYLLAAAALAIALFWLLWLPAPKAQQH